MGGDNQVLIIFINLHKWHGMGHKCINVTDSLLSRGPGGKVQGDDSSAF